MLVMVKLKVKVFFFSFAELFKMVFKNRLHFFDCTTKIDVMNTLCFFNLQCLPVLVYNVQVHVEFCLSAFLLGHQYFKMKHSILYKRIC